MILEIFIVLLWNDDDFRMVEPEDNTIEDDILMDDVVINQKNQFIGLIGALDKKELTFDSVGQFDKSSNYGMVESSPKKEIKPEDENNNTLEDLNNNSTIDCDITKDSIKIGFRDFTDSKIALSSAKSSDINSLLVNNINISSNIACANQLENADQERSSSGIKRNCNAQEELAKRSDNVQEPDPKGKHVNYQLLLFKMIFKVDVRLVKYLIFFTLAGFVLAPMSFLFISVSQECEKQKDCNFSRLAGYILICQASIETCCFLLVPFLQKMVGNLATLVIGLTSMSLRYLFYSFGYYNTGVSKLTANLFLPNPLHLHTNKQNILRS